MHRIWFEIQLATGKTNNETNSKNKVRVGTTAHWVQMARVQTWQAV